MPTEITVAGIVMRTELRKKCDRLSPPPLVPSTALVVLQREVRVPQERPPAGGLDVDLVGRNDETNTPNVGMVHKNTNT